MASTNWSIITITSKDANTSTSTNSSAITSSSTNIIMIVHTHIALLFALAFMDCQFQWEISFWQITRQRLVQSLWFQRQTPMKFHFRSNAEKINLPANLWPPTCIANFGQFWPKCSSFFVRNFFSFVGKLLKLAGQDWSTILRAHLSPKLPPTAPKCVQKFDLWDPKIGQKFVCPFLSRGQLNLWAKYPESKKQI